MKLAKILFRCDGSNELGYGHLNRCLNIAQWMRGKFDVAFCIKKTKEAKDILKKTNHEIHFMDPEVSPDAEFLEFTQYVRDWTPKVVVNDIKNTTDDYMRTISDVKTRTVNFDDLGNGADLANAVVDANRRENKKKFFGPKYVVLHPDFVKENKKKSVSITGNLTRLEIETYRFVKKRSICDYFFDLVAGKKQLRMFLTLSPV